MRASSSTGFIMKAIVALAWLAVLLASASLAASDDAGAASDTAVTNPWRREYWRSWPEVVGMSSEEAKKKICEDWPCSHVHVVPAGVYVTMAYDTRRVRVFLDSNDKVAKVPMIG